MIRGERCVAAELQLVKLVRIGRCRILRVPSDNLQEELARASASVICPFFRSPAASVEDTGGTTNQTTCNHYHNI